MVCGTHWAEDGAKEKQPVNLLALYQWIISRKLIANNPRFMLSTFNQDIKPVVSAMQVWGNKEIEKMRLANTLRRVVIDALYSIGIMKVALMTPADAAMTCWRMPAGSPMARRVDLDDWVGDIHARDLSEMYFEGFRYRAPLEAVKESRLFKKSVRDKLYAQNDPSYNQDGDERISMLGRGYYGMNTEEYEDQVTLWEIYLPLERLIVTLAADDSGYPDLDDDPLHVAPWIGHPNGPFHHLSYGLVPGNLMPLAPMMNLSDMHEATNYNWRKIMRVAERTKELTLFEQTSAEDADHVRDASDGQMVGVKDPKNFVQVVYGGQHLSALVAVANSFKELFSYAAGNLDMAGGLSPQSKTATQDKLLAQNASESVQSMQDDTVTFVAGGIESFGWYWWNDPFKIQEVAHQVPGIPEITQTRRVYPNHPRYTDESHPEFRGKPALIRQGSFNDLGIQVDPYSLPHSTPETRMATMQSVVTQVVLPMMQFCVQAGISFDMNKYLQKIGGYLNMPDLNEILTITPPPEDTSSGGSHSRTMPLSTERTVNRTSDSEKTASGQDKAMTTSLLSGKSQGGARSRSTTGFPAVA
jgi:hypothetical protein